MCSVGINTPPVGDRDTPVAQLLLAIKIENQGPLCCCVPLEYKPPLSSHISRGTLWVWIKDYGPSVVLLGQFQKGYLRVFLNLSQRVLN